ncbi:hypothetical protein BGZ96_009786 [Linnemannia gamsii]|uniref:Uncharacterized protein n=1 Tax=Linnemannia gamsii TaxID=64522 RepID=A0ABQ7JVR9_9FUNG|nr:hypothetical protein BGZ96_009786 [Linnemannia gamsii]
MAKEAAKEVIKAEKVESAVYRPLSNNNGNILKTLGVGLAGLTNKLQHNSRTPHRCKRCIDTVKVVEGFTHIWPGVAFSLQLSDSDF